MLKMLAVGNRRGFVESAMRVVRCCEEAEEEGEILHGACKRTQWPKAAEVYIEKRRNGACRWTESRNREDDGNKNEIDSDDDRGDGKKKDIDA